MESVLYTIFITLAVLMINGSVHCESSQGNEALQNTLIQRMDVIQNQLADVTSSIRSLNSDLDKALLSCIGIESELCDVLNSKSGQQELADLSSLLHPNKRSQDTHNDKHRRLVNELRRKREMAKYLMRMLRGADVVVTGEKKRACELNLGFHCQSEEISNFADVYDFLNSPHSPGKKRSVRATQ